MIPDCDRQTVGQTESIIAKTALCIASYADALSKIKRRLFLKSQKNEIEQEQKTLNFQERELNKLNSLLAN